MLGEALQRVVAALADHHAGAFVLAHCLAVVEYFVPGLQQQEIALGVDPLDRLRGQPDTGIGCDMGSGSSGGGWTIQDELGNPFVNGATSYGYKRLKNVLFAAYLTPSVQNILNSADQG